MGFFTVFLKILTFFHMFLDFILPERSKFSYTNIWKTLFKIPAETIIAQAIMVQSII